MRTFPHLLVSSILAALLYPIFSWKVLLVIAGGVLIDLDHYLWCICKYKKYNFFDCYRLFAVESKKRNFSDVKGLLIIFHTIEFLLIMVILSFYFELAFIFTIGVLSHYILDLIFLYFVPKGFIANHSIILWIFKNKIQKV